MFRFYVQYAQYVYVSSLNKVYNAFMLRKLIWAQDATKQHTPCMRQLISDLHMCAFVGLLVKTRVCCPVSLPTMSAPGGVG